MVDAAICPTAHNWLVGETDEKALLTSACAAVSDLFRERNVMSCVFGSRVLIELLTDIGMDATAVGVLLTVSDPAASAGLSGRQAVIGDAEGVLAGHAGPKGVLNSPDGYPGHVVVLARADNRVFLLDPTVFQASRLWIGTGMSPPATSLVLRLAEMDSLRLDEEVGAIQDGWTYAYSPQPELDWRTRQEWTGYDRYQLARVIRKRFAQATGLDLSRADTPGRNAACPCGSGKKYKRCCGNGSAGPNGAATAR